jgi:hypothetical protein
MRKRKDKRELRLRGEKTGGPNKAPPKPSFLIFKNGDQRKGRA